MLYLRIVLFINDTYNPLEYVQARLEVETCNDVPYCKHCNVDDYAHLGFSIEFKQLLGHRNSRDGASVVDLIA